MGSKYEKPWVCCGLLAEMEDNEDFRQPFLSFFEKDYQGRTFGVRKELLDVTCIDLDKFETAISGGRNQETMDLAVGIADFDETERKKSSHRLLPIELKLDCISFRSLFKERRNLINKDQHSRELLQAYPLEKKSFFIFTKPVAPQAERGFNQWGRERGTDFFKEWKALDPDRLSELLRFESDFPYLPITDLKNFQATITKFIETQDFSSVFGYLEYLRDLAATHYRKYRLEEVKHISGTVLHIISPLLPQVTQDQEYLGLLLEDFEHLRTLSDI